MLMRDVGSYFTTGKVLSMEELSTVQGRQWEDVDH